MNNKVPIVSVKGVSKSFGKVVACKNISLDIYPGEVHTLLGENGAGKSTLINILSGVYIPDSGVIRVKGQEKIFTSPKDSTDCGIGTENRLVAQHDADTSAATSRKGLGAL